MSAFNIILTLLTGDAQKKRQSSRAAAEEAIRKSKERCRFCSKPLPWIGRCPCPGSKQER